MKYLAGLVLVSLLLAGCYPLVFTRAKHTYFTGVNFQGYINQGFFITPEKYSGDYSPIGTYKVIITPAVTRKGLIRDSIADKWDTWSSQTVDIEILHVQDVVDSLVILSKQQGANALINFKYSTDTQKVLNYDVTSVIAEGFAIKIKK